jgi:methionyl-tRNA synthetase
MIEELNKSQISIDEFAKLDLRVGKIIEAENIPESKKLLKLKVNLGDEYGVRQILAGIGKSFSTAELINRNIVVLANLKPAMLLGHESQGMLLAVTNATTNKVMPIDPGQDVEGASDLLAGTQVR